MSAKCQHFIDSPLPQLGLLHKLTAPYRMFSRDSYHFYTCLKELHTITIPLLITADIILLPATFQVRHPKPKKFPVFLLDGLSRRQFKELEMYKLTLKFE